MNWEIENEELLPKKLFKYPNQSQQAVKLAAVAATCGKSTMILFSSATSMNPAFVAYAFPTFPL